MNRSRDLVLAPLALAAWMVASTASAAVPGSSKVEDMYSMIGKDFPGLNMQPQTGNTPSTAQWRLNPSQAFNGVANAFNGTARLNFSTTGGSFVCSGSLLPGGQYVLTAAHCADGLLSMTIQFGLYNGVALETRTMTSFVQHPGWNTPQGGLDSGSDLALIRLNAPVTNLNAYYLSKTNDVGKEYLMTGYGTTSVGSGAAATGWNDVNYGHYGFNVFDVQSHVVFAAWDAAHPGANEYTVPTYGFNYVSDYDSASQTNNTLDRIRLDSGSPNTWSSGLALPNDREALISGGDSGGGDFVWDAASGKWLLSGVHSWGWQFCGGRISPSCDVSGTNSSSYGDLSGSTATYTHIQWIESVVGNSVTVPIPEPGTYAMMALGLVAVGAAARRRKA